MTPSTAPTARATREQQNAARQPVREFVALHRDDPEVIDLIERQRSMRREDLPHGEMTDFVLANKVFMAMRDDLDLINWQTLAKERIRWLSVQLSDALDDVERLKTSNTTEEQPDAR